VEDRSVRVRFAPRRRAALTRIVEWIGVVVLSWAAVGCGGGEADRAASKLRAGFQFVDVAADAGLDRVIHAGRPGKDHLLDSAGSGAAWLDFDGDGRLDLYLVNAHRIEDGRIAEHGRNALYRGLGDGRFEDVTDRAGVADAEHWGCGVAVADYDDDGRPDLLVTNFGANVLYHNRGDGGFKDVSKEAGVEIPGWNSGASFFDADGDGDLDLYIAAYIEQSLDEVLVARRTLDWKGVDTVAAGPFGMPGAPDHFLLNRGEGRFDVATGSAGLTDHALGYGLGTRAIDVDDDGDIDMYVANDSDANFLYRNEGEGVFRETGLWSGAAFDVGGAAQAGMGVAAGDVDGNGTIDLVVTNFSEDFSTLYLGDGTGLFSDASDASGVGAATRLPLSWGTALADLDSDGDLDLVIANGHIYPQVDEHPEFGMRYEQRNQLLENLGDGTFREVTESAGPGFALQRSSRGLAVGDYDDDGDLDLLFTHLDRPPSLLRNESAQGHWLTVILPSSPGDGPEIGARLSVQASGRTFIRDLASGDSYLSSHDPRLHVGLGDATRVERLVVDWPDGQQTTLADVDVDQFIEVRRPDGG